jgi:hypothetical protein
MSNVRFEMKFRGLVLNEPKLKYELESPSGMVGKHLASKGRQIATLAKAQVGVRTGALRASIHMRHLADSRGQYVKVGSNLPYARMHHEGTKPHKIVPKRARVLRFIKKGQIVYADSVMHPGTRPNKYLVKAMKMVPGLYF